MSAVVLRPTFAAKVIRRTDGSVVLLRVTGPGVPPPTIPAFTALADQTPATLVTSNVVTVAGMTDGLWPIDATGGGAQTALRVNGGAWVTSGSVGPGDTVQLRTTSPGEFLSAAVTVRTPGRRTTWAVASGETPDPLADPYTWLNFEGTLANQGHGPTTFTAAPGEGYIDGVIGSGLTAATLSNADTFAPSVAAGLSVTAMLAGGSNESSFQTVLDWRFTYFRTFPSPAVVTLVQVTVQDSSNYLAEIGRNVSFTYQTAGGGTNFDHFVVTNGGAAPNMHFGVVYAPSGDTAGLTLYLNGVAVHYDPNGIMPSAPTSVSALVSDQNGAVVDLLGVYEDTVLADASMATLYGLGSGHDPFA
jgi:hypothetical protein